MSELSINQDDLPSSWALTSLGAVINYGSTSKAEPSEINDGDWVLELEDIEKDSSRLLQKMTFLQRQSKSTKNRFQAGDVLYGKLRPYLNKVLIAAEPGYCTTEILPLKAGPQIDNRYLFYWLKHPVFLKYVEAESHGMNMPRLGTETGKAAPFVLAPRSEQTRIANQLDTLLTRVQACNDRFDAIPALLKRFRQTIYMAATSGAMTESENTADAWIETTIGAVSSDLRYGTSKKCDYSTQGTGVLRIPNIAERGRIDVTDLKRAVFDSKELQKLSLQEGDLLVIRSNGSVELVGKTGLVTADESGLLFAGYLMRLRVNPLKALPAFIQICLSAPAQRRYIERTAKSTSGVNNLNAEELRALPLLLPTLTEQAEIVRRVEALFKLADQIEARCTAARAQAQRLSPLVLAKAFRGELVPQDPTDEPATQLLGNLAAQKRLLAKQPKVLRSSNEHVIQVPMDIGVTNVQSKTRSSFSIPVGLEINVDFEKTVELSQDQLRNLRDLYSVRRTNNAISMTKSRNDEDVKNKPYLADQLRILGRPTSAEELFKISALPVDDFYKQLVWEVAQRYVIDGKTTLEAGDAT
jgi:type I restriction enzyme, S subunit